MTFILFIVCFVIIIAYTILVVAKLNVSDYDDAAGNLVGTNIVLFLVSFVVGALASSFVETWQIIITVFILLSIAPSYCLVEIIFQENKKIRKNETKKHS